MTSARDAGPDLPARLRRLELAVSHKVFGRRDESALVGLLAAALSTVPLAAFWLWTSLRLPHGDASWRALLPGAILVAIGFQVLHVLIVEFLVPKLEKSTTLYGSLGAMTTILFFMYFAGRLVVTSPILNSSLHHELRTQGDDNADDGTTLAGLR